MPEQPLAPKSLDDMRLMLDAIHIAVPNPKVWYMRGKLLGVVALGIVVCKVEIVIVNQAVGEQRVVTFVRLGNFICVVPSCKRSQHDQRACKEITTLPSIQSRNRILAGEESQDGVFREKKNSQVQVEGVNNPQRTSCKVRQNRKYRRHERN